LFLAFPGPRLQRSRDYRTAGTPVATRRFVPTTFVRRGPPAVLADDARRRPDRRWKWRGGRRDSDWTKRPLAMRRVPAAGEWLHKFRRWMIERVRRSAARVRIETARAARAFTRPVRLRLRFSERMPRDRNGRPTPAA
jgi:hypothetical protein